MNNDIDLLIKDIYNLTSFEEIKDWDLKANDFIFKLESEISNNIKLIDEKKIEIENINKVNENKSFFKKLFSKDVLLINKINLSINDLLNANINYKNKIENLQSWINITPDNNEEKVLMIKELKEAKKKIQLQKKEIRLMIKETNINSRTANSKVSNQIIFTNSKLKKIQRVSIRDNKEKALAPLESEMRDLENTELYYDKLLLFLNNISK